MSAKDPLHRLTVSSPCSQDWNAMIGNDQVRFCEHCSLNVHNISQMTRAKALRLVETSKGRICVRYYRDTNGTVATRSVSPRLYQLGRRVSRVAAGAFSATLSLSAAVAQQPSALQPDSIPVIQSSSGWRLGACSGPGCATTLCSRRCLPVDAASTLLPVGLAPRTSRPA